MKLQDLLLIEITWIDTNDLYFPYEAQLKNGTKLKLRVNDFPDQPLFSVFVNDEYYGDLDDLPVRWHTGD